MRHFCHRRTALRALGWVLATPIFLCCQTLATIENENPRKAECITINREYIAHQVGFCEETGKYAFYYPQQRIEYHKYEFENAVRTYIHRWLTKTPFDGKLVSRSEVEVWLLSPVLNPWEPSLVLQIRQPSTTIAAILPVDIRKWPTQPDYTIVLDEDGLPSRAGRTPGALHIELHAQNQESTFRTLLQDYAHLHISKDANPMFELATPLFEENRTAIEIYQHPVAQDIVAAISYKPATIPYGNLHHIVSISI